MGMEDTNVVNGVDERLSRVLAVINGKGGSGKTSCTANIAGQLARAGAGPILAVDLDLSGNLKLDLGYVGHPGDDDGRGLVEAIWSESDIPVLHGVRDGLDVVPGGRHLEMLAALSSTPTAAELPGGGVPTAFAARLAPLAAQYELILLDCAPGNPVLQDMALAATRYILIPTKTDAAGWEGLRMVGPRVKKARQTNPALTYLGVVLFGHQSNATRVRKNTRARLAEVGDVVPVLDAYVRHSETAAHDCRLRGQLAHELARDAAASTKERLAALGRRRGRHMADNVIEMPTPAGDLEIPAALSGTADSLAGDYARLAREVLARIGTFEDSASAENPASSSTSAGR